jgi:hypothetical protein
MNNKSTLELKNAIDMLRNELDSLLKSGEIDIGSTLELSRELDTAINNFNKSLSFNMGN